MRGSLNKYCITILFLAAVSICAQSKIVFGKQELIEQLKDGYETNNYILKIIKIADKYVDKEVKTIASVISPMGEDHKHDYFSEGPYWWPNPEDPDGPYIRKDGERNPDRFNEHRHLRMELHQALTSLSVAAYFSGKKKYADKANEYLFRWFVNPDTKMAPHLKYAQMIRNKDVLRGVGIIETHRFVQMVDMIRLLNASRMASDKTMAGFSKWLESYNSWLINSKWGIDEKYRGNNHSSWWAAQVLTFSDFLGKDSEVTELTYYTQKYLIERHFDEDCRQPLEDIRTRSLSYNFFNLNALSFCLSVLDKKGTNLFKKKNKQGCSYTMVAERINKYAANPSEWELKQLKKLTSKPRIYMALTGLINEDQKFLKFYAQLLSEQKDEEVNTGTDPFELLLNAQVILAENNRIKNYN